MEEMLKDYGVKALEWLESGAAFLAGEIPIYVQEIIMWELASSIISLVLGLIFLLGNIPMIHFTLKWKEKLSEKYESWQDASHTWLFGLLYCVPSLFALIPFTHGIYSVVKIIVAPRVYLIEYLSSLF